MTESIAKMIDNLDFYFKYIEKGVKKMPKKDGTGPPAGGRKQDGSGGGKGRRTNEKGSGVQKGGKKGVKK